MITRKDVLDIARLARIELSKAEQAKFEKELSSILEFVAELNEVAAADVAPLTGGQDLANVMREDEGEHRLETASPKELVEAAPAHRDGYVTVKAVFERE